MNEDNKTTGEQYWKTGEDLYIGDPFGDAIELSIEEYEYEKLKRLEIKVREERDCLIAAAEWRIRRYQDQIILGIEPTENVIPVLQYIQALRDVPQQEGFPTNIVWPEAPV